MARSTSLGSSSQAITSETSLTLSNFSWKMGAFAFWRTSSLVFAPTYLHQSNSPTTTFILAVLGLSTGMFFGWTQCLAVRMYRLVRMVPPQLPTDFASPRWYKIAKNIWYGAKTEKLPPIILFSLVSLLSSFFVTQLRVSGPGPRKKEFLCHYSLIYKVLTLLRCHEAFPGFPDIESLISKGNLSM